MELGWKKTADERMVHFSDTNELIGDVSFVCQKKLTWCHTKPSSSRLMNEKTNKVHDREINSTENERINQEECHLNYLVVKVQATQIL